MNPICSSCSPALMAAVGRYIPQDTTQQVRDLAEARVERTFNEQQSKVHKQALAAVTGVGRRLDMLA
jgi:hypothetical protein